MMNGEDCVRIERFTNGYTVNIKDPAIVKWNNQPYEKREKKGGPSYREPWKSFVFKTDKEVLAFLAKNLKKAIVASDNDGDEFGTAFTMAAADNDGDE